MTPEEINIAIAEENGWEYVGTNGIGEPYGYPNLNLKKSSMNYEIFPDYFNDLNACHDFENVLTDEEFYSYVLELRQVCGAPWRSNDQGERHVALLIRATAAQKSEAFLKAIGKYNG